VDDPFRAWRELNERVREVVERTRELSRIEPSQAIDPDEMYEYEVEKQADAYERALRRAQHREPEGDPGIEPDLSGRPMPGRATLKALKRYAEGATIRGIENAKILKYRRARRAWSWHTSRTVFWDFKEQKFVVAPGYKLVQEGRNIRLIRTDSPGPV
jgi:hypothetical protein